jgi:hypothetical protein
MCNNLRNEKRVYKIPEEGVGYKVFNKGNKGRKTLTTPFHEANIKKNKWTKWQVKPYTWVTGDGFCFLYTLKDVKEFMGDTFPEEWVVHRIQYKEGLGRRREGEKWWGGYMSSLCKEYKILEEVTL